MRAIGPETRVYALVGSPVRHSRSPALHNHWFEEHGIDAVYVALEVDPAAAPRLFEAITTLGLAGVNLTVPFKASILGQVPARTPLVDAIGAANVLVPVGGVWTAHNTDAEGWIRGFEADFGLLSSSMSVLVLGAGGAGRAVAAGARGRGAQVTVLDRRFPERGDAALAAFPRQAARADVVVDCTTGSSEVDGFDLSGLPADAVWCDINYWRDDPPAMRAARNRGLRVQDGYPMLVHQAASSFALFTGVTPDRAHIPDQLR